MCLRAARPKVQLLGGARTRERLCGCVRGVGEGVGVGVGVCVCECASVRRLGAGPFETPTRTFISKTPAPPKHCFGPLFFVFV